MDPVKLTPGQQRVVDEAPLRQEIARLKRERDEALAQRDALAAELKWIGENATDVPIADAAFAALAELDEERGAESMRRYIEQGGENG